MDKVMTMTPTTRMPTAMTMTMTMTKATAMAMTMFTTMGADDDDELGLHRRLGLQGLHRRLGLYCIRCTTDLPT